VKCRYKKGISDKEIDKMKKAGLDPEISQDGDKKYIKSFNTTDIEGREIKITAANFEEHYGNNPHFRAQMDQIAKPKGLLLRGKQTLSLVFDKYKINRKNPIGDSPDEKEIGRSMRRTQYGDGNETAKANNAPDGGEENKQEATKIAGVDDSINQAAQA